MKSRRDGGLVALWALIVWAAHFLLAYALALVLPEASVVKPMIIALTLAALIALVLLLKDARASSTRQAIAKQSVLLAAIAIVWQSLVVLF